MFLFPFSVFDRDFEREHSEFRDSPDGIISFVTARVERPGVRTRVAPVMYGTMGTAAARARKRRRCSPTDPQIPDDLRATVADMNPTNPLSGDNFALPFVCAYQAQAHWRGWAASLFATNTVFLAVFNGVDDVPLYNVNNQEHTRYVGGFWITDCVSQYLSRDDDK